MTEDNRQKEIRLRKELAQVRAANNNESRKTTKNRDFSVGLPKDTTPKPRPSSADIPDVITLPPKQRGKKENIPF
tara:strand:- start:6896 stop:7120 length:225 start_codon:yes stop_codon:yes gene_type:complete